MADDALILEQQGHVLIATLNNPERRNALNPEMREGICVALERTNQDDSVRVLVVTGAGNSFCSGADVRSLSQGAEAARQGGDGGDGGARIFDVRGLPQPGPGASGFDFSLLFWELRKPTIAAIGGPAIGAGLGLAMCCDMRIASTDARVGAGFTRIGLSSEWGLSFILPRVIGAARTYELMYTGRLFDAEEMERMGLVNRVAPRDELMSATLELAEAVAAMPPLSMQRVRQGVRRGMEAGDFRDQVAYEAYLQSMSASSFDHREATRAFLEKRTPQFEGR